MTLNPHQTLTMFMTITKTIINKIEGKWTTITINTTTMELAFAIPTQA